MRGAIDVIYGTLQGPLGPSGPLDDEWRVTVIHSDRDRSLQGLNLAEARELHERLGRALERIEDLEKEPPETLARLEVDTGEYTTPPNRHRRVTWIRTAAGRVFREETSLDGKKIFRRPGQRAVPCYEAALAEALHNAQGGPE